MQYNQWDNIFGIYQDSVLIRMGV